MYCKCVVTVQQGVGSCWQCLFCVRDCVLLPRYGDEFQILRGPSVCWSLEVVGWLVGWFQVRRASVAVSQVKSSQEKQVMKEIGIHLFPSSHPGQGSEMLSGTDRTSFAR